MTTDYNDEMDISYHNRMMSMSLEDLKCWKEYYKRKMNEEGEEDEDWEKLYNSTEYYINYKLTRIH